MTSQVTTDANTVVLPREASGQDIVELVNRAKEGDTEAFGTIYDRYKSHVLRYCYYRTHNRATAEDLCSDVFLRAMKGIGSFHWQGKDIGAWLTTIARNLVADYYKNSRTRREISVDEMVDSNGASLYAGDTVGTSAYPDPIEDLLERELEAHVRYAVEYLNPEQRKCIQLRFFEGLSCKDTAREMGKNEGAVKTLQWRATASLGRHLKTLQPDF